MSAGEDDARAEPDTPSLVRSQINRYALIYALVGAGFLHFGLFGKLKIPPPPWESAAAASGGALLLAIAAGLVARARWALPLALVVHTAATIGIIASMCMKLAHANDANERSQILLHHAGAVVAFVTSMLFWRRADVRAWLASKSEQSHEERS